MLQSVFGMEEEDLRKQVLANLDALESESNI
jgi:hypothetical protein